MALFLVTGGCGFIGSHLCAALRAQGHQVRVLDDLSTGHVGNLAPGVDLIRGDVSDARAVRRAMAGVDGCFHLAAVASVERGVTAWRETHTTNLSGTITVFEAASQAKRTHTGVPTGVSPGVSPGMPTGIPVVYASSAAVYGDNQAAALSEDAATIPLSAYGADKLGCELHARVAGGTHGIPTAGLRFFNVFGPRQDPLSPYSGVISIFCDKLLRGQSIDVFGDGGQTRDFIFVTDVVAALQAAMARVSVDASVYNVCSGQPTSVRDLASMIAGLCETPLQIVRQPPRAGEIRHSLGSPRRAAASLGLGQPVGLRDGLMDILAWLRAGRPSLAA